MYKNTCHESFKSKSYLTLVAVECESEYADVKNPHKALSFAKRASTSDSPLVLQLLTAASLEAGGKAAGSDSTASTVSFSNTLSLSIQEL